jgi:hypothetical protein
MSQVLEDHIEPAFKKSPPLADAAQLFLSETDQRAAAKSISFETSR